jgi:hypothetical protein
MNCQVVVEAGGKPVVVKVEASNETTAHLIARWLVAHAARLQAKESTKER